MSIELESIAVSQHRIANALTVIAASAVVFTAMFIITVLIHHGALPTP